MTNHSHEKNSSQTLQIISAIIIVILLIGAVVFATRSKDSGNTAANIPSDESVSQQIAPDFSLDKLGGGTITLAEYRGRKPVVLDFWTTWCPNCKRSMPNLSAFYEKYKDQVEVIGINMNENTSLVQKTITKWGITFPIALDSNSSVTQAYGVRYTNVHVLIDKEGNVVRFIPGDISEADIQSLIN